MISNNFRGVSVNPSNPVPKFAAFLTFLALSLSLVLLNVGVTSIEQGNRLSSAQVLTPEENNWAGYIATTDAGNPFTDVSGRWRVPDIIGSAVNSMADIWVGIGGAASVGGGNIIQVGTELWRDNNGVYHYRAWYENYQAPPVFKGDVTSGHDMSAAIWKVGANTWNVFLGDDTINMTIISENVNTAANPPNQRSAEWIVESHFDGGLDLPVFGIVNFRDCMASRGGGASQPVSDFTFERWDIEHNGKKRTTTSSLSPDGKSFTITITYIALGVGGIVVPVDKFALLAPYIGLASTPIIAAVAATVYVKRVRRRKEKQ